MHPLFAIDELLRVICSYQTPHELAISARVSFTWFQCAVPLLYNEINIYDGLLLLGEVESSLIGLRFANEITNKDWNRFAKYAPYVQILRVTGGYELLISKAMLRGASNGVPYLFPNTRQLYWFAANSERGVLSGLITPSIDQVHICTDYYDSCFLQELFHLTMTRLHALSVLRILNQAETIFNQTFVSDVRDIVTFFASTLTSVYLPLCLNTRSIIKCLSKVPNLRDLVLEWDPSAEDIVDPDDINHDHDHDGIRRDSFNNMVGKGQKDVIPLRSFSFAGGRRSLYDGFFHTYDLSSLLQFSWCFNISPADVDAFVLIIISNCPRLQSLTLGKPQMTNRQYPPVPWLSIQPIIRCKELIKLSLNCIRPEISLEELTEFLKSRTTWTHLDMFTLTPLHLQNILLYAEYCPNLRHLGVSVDAQPDFKDLPSNHPIFPVLTSIDFGPSDFDMYSGYQLGSFLYKICKRPPYISGKRESELHTLYHAPRVIARIYISEEKSTGEPMSIEAREYVSKIREEEGLSQSSEEASDSEPYDSSEERDDSEGIDSEWGDEYDEENDPDYVDSDQDEDNS